MSPATSGSLRQPAAFRPLLDRHRLGVLASFYECVDACSYVRDHTIVRDLSSGIAKHYFFYVADPQVTPRYWSDPEGHRREELSTGDLGYMAEGRLFLIGRLKDLIIVGGENHIPTDIEGCAAAIAGVHAGGTTAFGTYEATRGTERVVVVCEVDAESGRAPGPIAEDVSAAIRSRLGLDAEIVIVHKGTIERTTSGKVRRGACRQRYERGTLPRLA